MGCSAAWALVNPWSVEDGTPGPASSAILMCWRIAMLYVGMDEDGLSY